jgi:hypothetical protein
MKWRRFIKCVIVFALLGAMLNLAIAWGSAFVNIRSSGIRPVAIADPSFSYSHWELTQSGTFASRRIMAMHDLSGGSPAFSGQLPRGFSDFMPRLYQRSADAVDSGRWQLRNGEFERVPPLIMEARGWPCLALRCEWDFRKGDALNDGIRLPPRESRRISGSPSFQYSVFLWDLRALPYRPIWEGLIINTVFYALLAWLLWISRHLLPSRIRARRLKRGVCPRCKYPIGASPVCTECGAALDRGHAANS